MLAIKGSNFPDVSLIDIVDDYEVLHYDQDPILFTGRNSYGMRILASLIETDLRNKIDRHFHIPLTSALYHEFLRGRVSYLKIIEDFGKSYIIDTSFDRTHRQAYVVEYSDIPKEYLPLGDSYFTDDSETSSLTYGMKLIGNWADAHFADPLDAALIQSEMKHLIDDSCPSFCDIVPIVRMSPPAQSSFLMTFDISVRSDPQLKLFPVDYPGYIKNYLDYCLNHFQEEVRALATVDIANAPYLRELLSRFKGVISNQQMDERVLTQNLTDMIERSVKRLVRIAETAGDKFSSAELINFEAEKGSLIGIIERRNAEQYSSAIEAFEIVRHRISEDVLSTEYDILVYSFNTNSKRGAAIIIFDKNSETPKVKILIRTDKNLDNSIFTESLHFSKRIKVQARARRMNDKIVSLSIDY